MSPNSPGGPPAGPSAGAVSASRQGLLQRASARRWRPMALWVAATMVVVAVLGWLPLMSGLLDVRQVTVTGTSRLSADAVRAATGVQVGSPLARVDTDQVRERVSALPPAAAASVTRSWPSTLTVHVVERRAAAVIQAGASWQLVDAGGTAFATERTAPRGLPVLRSAGAPAELASRTGLAVLATLPPALRSVVQEVSVKSPSSITLRVGGRTVVWGSPEDAARKAAVTSALLRQPGVRWVDVSAPNVAVVR